MGQNRLERKRTQLVNSERFLLELLLIIYGFIYIGANVWGNPQFTWLILISIGAVLSYVIFSKVDYSVGPSIMIPALIAVPLYVMGLHFIPVLIIFVYTFWRFKANFGDSKVKGWPFIFLNTLILACSYLFSMFLFVNDSPHEVFMNHIILYCATTVLFIIVRFLVIWKMGRIYRQFNFVEATKIFGSLLGIGALTYIVVYFLLVPVRNGIIATVAFLFSGIFMMFGKAVTPLLDWVIARFDAAREAFLAEADPQKIAPMIEMQEERKIMATEMKDIDLMIMIVIGIVVVIAFILILRNRKKAKVQHEDSAYTVRTYGRKKNRKKPQKSATYDYSSATDSIRQAYRDFEQQAHDLKMPRLAGETVKEWFSRMGWGLQQGNEVLFNTYDKVRYGSFMITEEERNQFIHQLEKLKEKIFSKDV
ncbi:DUF4129 domain-containing protein [Filibacter tadaridae]|uniref:DUF4129 domain-containing protein n=1 Tax=Filibacter tadaridae TaxID=2483811 RepID=A0A3P5XGC0_9BACL|nr:DUF4129 domain-containing protein [Filibacter tadaridae]VDC29922.1 hypothetical protein FILTAD_02474 [Filibacter tadaridae]